MLRSLEVIRWNTSSPKVDCKARRHSSCRQSHIPPSVLGERAGSNPIHGQDRPGGSSGHRHIDREVFPRLAPCSDWQMHRVVKKSRSVPAERLSIVLTSCSSPVAVPVPTAHYPPDEGAYLTPSNEENEHLR